MTQTNDYEKLKIVSLLFVEDDLLWREQIVKYLSRRMGTVYGAENGRQGLRMYEQHHPDIIVTDIQMPELDGLEMARMIKEEDGDVPIILTTAFSDVPKLVKAIEIGVDSYVQKPTTGKQLLQAIYKLALPIIQRRELEELVQGRAIGLEKRLGHSRAMRQVINNIQRLAKSDFSLILQGETGVGKSYIARIIHDLSRRVDKPFIPVDIGAMPESLVESELFGYSKGAFTGAERDKKGFFAAADKGTIFLDELENMTPYVQGKLLHVVEEKRITRLGTTEPELVDVRIMAATNKDIVKAVKDKRFREDLYYRLNTFTIDIPPLRERPEDIAQLSDLFVVEACEELGVPIKTITPKGKRLLMSYPWFGNVRELKNTVRKIVLLTDDAGIGDHAVRGVIDAGKTITHLWRQPGKHNLPSLAIEDLEKWAIERALEVTGGKKMEAALLLKIGYSTLKRKMKKFGIQVGETGETDTSDR